MTNEPSTADGPRKKRLAVGIALLILAGGAGGAYALTFINLPTELITLFGQNTGDSNIAATGTTTTVWDNDTLRVTVLLSNGDTGAAHTANVTVRLLDSTGAEFVNQSKPTGSIASSGTGSLPFTFSGTNFAVNYEKAYITIRQLT